MVEQSLVSEAFADCVLIGLGLGPRIDLGGAIQYGDWGGLYWWPVILVFRNGSIPLDVFIKTVCSAGLSPELVEHEIERCAEELTPSG